MAKKLASIIVAGAGVKGFCDKTIRVLYCLFYLIANYDFIKCFNICKHFRGSSLRVWILWSVDCLKIKVVCKRLTTINFRWKLLVSLLTWFGDLIIQIHKFSLRFWCKEQTSQMTETNIRRMLQRKTVTSFVWCLLLKEACTRQFCDKNI